MVETNIDFLVHHLLRSSADRYPEKEALVHGDQRLTYSQVARQTAGLAYGLQRTGLQRGNRVGIYLGPSVQQAVSIFAISQAGGVFVPINDALFPKQVAHIAKDCGMKGLITDRSKLAKLTDIVHDIPSLEFLIVLESDLLPTSVLPTHGFEELCELAPPQPWTDICIEKDLAAILYTSGSTGKPKGIMLSHGNIIAGICVPCIYACGIDDTRPECSGIPFDLDIGI